MGEFKIVVENGTLFDGRVFTLYKCPKSGRYDIHFENGEKVK